MADGGSAVPGDGCAKTCGRFRRAKSAPASLLATTIALTFFAAPAAADAGPPGTAPTPTCPDYGSYAVVDTPRAPRGVIAAEPYSACAELPSAGQRYPLYIGVDVQLGNQSGSGQNGSGQNGTDQNGTDKPQGKLPPGGWGWPGGPGGSHPGWPGRRPHFPRQP